MSTWVRKLVLSLGWQLPTAVVLGSVLVGAGGCDTQTKQAIGCNTNADCPGGQVCGMTGQCIPPPKTIVVSITKLGDGAGSVTSQPAGIECGATCSGSFELGKPITLTATPQSGSTASGWSIGCTGTGPTCTFTPTLDEPVQVAINFAVQAPIQPPALCNAQSFCWENPRPQGNLLNDVAVLPSGEVWAVGQVGTVVRRVGTTHSLPSSGTVQHLTGAAVVGTDVVMVGTSGTVMRGSGGLVTGETSGILQDLLDVTAVGTGAVAVGVGGKILRRNGIAWSSDTSITTQTLRGVGNNGTEIFAVGDNGTVVANSGSNWRTVTDPQFGSKPLSAVAALSGSAYVAAQQGDVFRQGTPWSRVCCVNLPDIRSMISSSFGLIAVGSTVGGAILQSSDGTTWTTPIDGAQTLFYGVGATTGEAWAVGDSGAMMQYKGGAWSPQSSGSTRLLRAISGTAQGYFAVGQSGALLRSVSTSVLSSTAPLAPDFAGVSAVSSTEAWAVGDVGTIYRFDGSAWNKVTSGTGSTLRGVWAAGADDVWAVGDAGTVVHVKNGSATAMSGGTTQNLLTVWGTGPNDIWAAGAAGAVVRYTGTSFVPVTGPATSKAITSIWGNLSSNIWMVAGPDVFVWNGNNYQKYTPSGTDLAAVAGYGADLYVVGTKGQLHRYSGGNFSLIETGTRNNLYAVALSATTLWLAGDNGTILSKAR